MKTLCCSATVALTLSIGVTGCDVARDSDPGGAQLFSLDEERSEFVWLDTVEGRLGGRAYLGPELEGEPVLVIVLHGDLLDPDDSYHYSFASAIASDIPNAVAVGLLRPGYSDERGNRSDGDILTASGDNYTREVIDAVAEATRQLAVRYQVGATILIGHSGGAAIAALVLGHHSEVVDAALLIACPCDLPAWRAYMLSVRSSPVWEQSHQGLSPLDATHGVRSTSIVELLVGDEDDVVKIEYSEDYARALRARGVDARVTILPGLGHNILLRPRVIGVANRLITRVEALD